MPATTASFDLTLDCADARLRAEFWKAALGYIDEPPPAPFTTGAEWRARFDLPEHDSEGDGAWLCDPGGAGPCLSILKVPEGKPGEPRTGRQPVAACW